VVCDDDSGEIDGGATLDVLRCDCMNVSLNTEELRSSAISLSLSLSMCIRVDRYIYKLNLVIVNIKPNTRQENKKIKNS
jgi:hypothetical protein